MTRSEMRRQIAEQLGWRVTDTITQADYDRFLVWASQYPNSPRSLEEFKKRSRWFVIHPTGQISGCDPFHIEDGLIGAWERVLWGRHDPIPYNNWVTEIKDALTLIQGLDGASLTWDGFYNNWECSIPVNPRDAYDGYYVMNHDDPCLAICTAWLRYKGVEV